MKTHSIQFKFLITVISAMLAITIFVGGLSIYEVDSFVQSQAKDFILASCEKEATQVNDMFGDMEKSVRIMESYVLDLVESKADIKDRDAQEDILESTDRMFADIAKHTNGAIAYYMRFTPELSDNKTGVFYSKIYGSVGYVRLEPTDLSLYDPDDTAQVGWYWLPYKAGEPVWLQPYYNQNNGITMISYVVPLYYQQQFIGIVGMDFDYTTLTDRVHEIKIYDHGFAHLELDGAVVHEGNHETAHDDAAYLRVSEDLLNGMTLVLSASYDDIRQIRYDIELKILCVVLFLAALFSLVVILVVRRIVTPLKELTEVSKSLSTGNYDIKIGHSDTYEIKLLSTAFEHMAMRLQEHAKLQHLLAYRDSLTGLRNTTSYQGWATDFNKEIQGKQIHFGVVVFDLNYLKETNDKYGHDAGNQLIITAARIISNTFKRSPVFRIGGDEFLVILQNKDLEDREPLLAELDSRCANEFIDADGIKIPVSIAKGFAEYEPDRDSQFVDVFNRADDAMYENKRSMKTAQV